MERPGVRAVLVCVEKALAGLGSGNAADAGVGGDGGGGDAVAELEDCLMFDFGQMLGLGLDLLGSQYWLVEHRRGRAIRDVE